MTTMTLWSLVGAFGIAVSIPSQGFGQTRENEVVLVRVVEILDRAETVASVVRLPGPPARIEVSVTRQAVSREMVAAILTSVDRVRAKADAGARGRVALHIPASMKLLPVSAAESPDVNRVHRLLSSARTGQAVSVEIERRRSG